MYRAHRNLSALGVQYLQPPPVWRITKLDVYVHNLLSMKSFHGVLSENVHECSLKPSIGKVRILPFERLAQHL